MKTCKKCGETKAFELFAVSSRTRDGHLGVCRGCTLAYAKQWKQDNPEKVTAWYDNHLESIGKTRRVLKTPEEIRTRQNEYNRRWLKQDRAKHPEKYKSSPRKIEWQKIDRLMNPEKYKRYVKNCYERNRQKYIAKTNAWREANKEYVAEKQKTYNRNRVDNLRDTYVKNLIKGKTEIPIATIPQALIEAKRLQLKIRRMTNEKHNTTT
jgi:hypothetical protein